MSCHRNSEQCTGSQYNLRKCVKFKVFVEENANGNNFIDEENIRFNL